MTREERTTYSSDHVATIRRLERKWLPKVTKAIKSKVSSLITKLKEDGISAAIKYLQVDLGNFKLRATIEAMYLEVGLRYARKAERRLRSEIGKSTGPVEQKRTGTINWTEFIKNYLQLYLLEKITFQVAETTRDKLLAILQEAIEKGWGIDEIVKRLEDLPFVRFQAQRIVRTEINRAANVGTYAQGQGFEYELMKEWIAVKDNRTRGNPANGQDDHADHYRMDEQTVDFFDVFRDPRNGHELQHPGDPKAQAVDVVNCRCNMATKPKRDENGRLIPRKSRISVILPGQNRPVPTITI